MIEVALSVAAIRKEQCSVTRGDTPPYLSPYFAAKAAMDAPAVSYAAELASNAIEGLQFTESRMVRAIL